MSLLTFVSPPPGLGAHNSFHLNPIPGVAGLYSLSAVNDDALRLFVLDAAVFLPAYSPVLSEDQRTALGLSSPSGARVLVVANPVGGKTTVNLLAPIVVNADAGRCAQVILDGQDWPVQAELQAA